MKNVLIIIFAVGFVFLGCKDSKLIEKKKHLISATKYYYNENGKESNTTEFIYDNYGNVIEEIDYDSVGNKDYSCIYKLRYDSEGNIMEELELPDGKLYRKTKYHYNKNGNLSEKTYRNPSGKITREFKYLYDKRDSLIEEVSDFMHGSIYTSLINYNDNGYRISEMTYDSDGKLVISLDYKYNKSWQTTEIIENMIMETGNRQWRNIFKYDMDEIKIEDKRVNSEGKLIVKTIFKYSNK